jgi:hypothetical protein
MIPSAIVVCDFMRTVEVYKTFKGKVAKLSMDIFRNEKMTIVQKGIIQQKLTGSINDIPVINTPRDLFECKDPYNVSVFFDLAEPVLDRLIVHCNTNDFNGYFVDLTIERDPFYGNLRKTIGSFSISENTYPAVKKIEKIVRLVDPADKKRFISVIQINI